MTNQNDLKNWLQYECPRFWALLNQKGQSTLPKGLVEYISEGEASEIDAGRCNLKAIEHTLSALLDQWTYKTIVDAYRRDLSGIGTATQLAELLCEIALCASIGNLSETLQLRPPTGKGTHSDFLAKINACELYGESKRYEDPWPYIANPHEPVIPKVPYKRSITQQSKEQKPTDSARPRSMDLRSKLQNVPRQFPDQTLNILFVFHRSVVGESRRYMTQTLFGDANFFRAENTCALESDGIFAIEEWRNVSACCLSRRCASSGEVVFPYIWENPRAFVHVPQSVLDALHGRTRG